MWEWLTGRFGVAADRPRLKYRPAEAEIPVIAEVVIGHAVRQQNHVDAAKARHERNEFGVGTSGEISDMQGPETIVVAQRAIRRSHQAAITLVALQCRTVQVAIQQVFSLRICGVEKPGELRDIVGLEGK